MKRVGIKEFKAKLSAFLRMVEAGEAIIVTDRGRDLVEVRQMAVSAGAPSGVERAIADGWATPPRIKGDWAFLKGPGPRLPAGTASDLIDRGRGEDDALR